VPARGEVPRAGLLVGAYALSGAGLVPPMVYLADYAARGHGLGVQAGGLMWVVFGAGALVGSLSGGALAGRIGGRRAMVAGLAAQLVALALPLLPALAGLVAGGFLSGAATVGITAVALVAARERAGAQAGLVWVRVTAGFALAQAATGFALAALFAASAESHAAIFAAGAALSAGALVLGVMDRRAGA
jgi:predicted MFS family arabinose efflux permease